MKHMRYVYLGIVILLATWLVVAWLPAAAKVPPAQDGSALVQERCTKCHNLDRVKAAHKAEDGWTATVERMIGHGAQLNDAEKAAVIQFLAETQAPAATEAPAAGGERVLRTTEAWPCYIDPAVGLDYASSVGLVNLYDSLVFPNVKGGVDPWLGESWKTSDDGLTWTFMLKKGVKFHDGSELKASDVVYSMKRLLTVGEGYAYLFVNLVKDVEAVDDYTVEFTLDHATGLFLPSLSRLYVLNEKLVRANTKTEGPYKEDGDYGKEWLLTHDAGSGAYMVKEFPLQEYLLMEKNQAWWGKFVPNAPDTFRMTGTTEASTIRTLMSNKELEITDQWQSVEGLKALQGMEGLKVAAFTNMSSFYLMINTKMAPTDDVHCRKAMEYGFDYPSAVGLEWEGTQPMAAPVPAQLGGAATDLGMPAYDVEKAKAELAQCKYANELDKNPVKFVWISEVPDEEKFALLFQANMNDLGIPVEIVKTPWQSVVENTSKLETSPSIVSIYVSSDLPEAGPMLKQRYHSSTAPTWSQNEWLLDETLDKAIDDALATLDQTERFNKYHEIQKTIVDLGPSVFVYDQLEKRAYQTYIDWPAAKGEVIPMMGYNIFAANIGINK